MDVNIDLLPGEPHPAAHIAQTYLSTVSWDRMELHKEAIASCAIDGNRTAEICVVTLRRLQNGDPVSDRYLMGLAWFIWSLEIDEIERIRRGEYICNKCFLRQDSEKPDISF